MNQKKIGRFIAECRRNQDLTQMQLAEKLNVTDKAVSKWERGVSMPDASIMIELCEIIGINVNELLCGEKNNMEDNDKKNQDLLLEMANEIKRKNKAIWISMWVIMIVSLTALLGGILVAAFLVQNETYKIIIVITVCVLFIVPCFFALKLEVSVGAYKCKNCGHEIVPTYIQALNAMHRGTTRYLKCPKCGKRTWCKKVIK